MSKQKRPRSWELSLSRRDQLGIIDQLPDIELALTWEHDQGRFSESREIATKKYYIVADISISGTVTKVYAGDYFVQEEKETKIEKPEIGEIHIFDLDGNQMHFTEKQYTSLAFNIKENIRIEDDQ